MFKRIAFELPFCGDCSTPLLLTLSIEMRTLTLELAIALSQSSQVSFKPLDLSDSTLYCRQKTLSSLLGRPPSDQILLANISYP